MMNEITIQQLLQIPHYTLIDIRDERRFQEGRIPNSMNIPMAKLLSNPNQYLNTTTTYYIYCEFGYQSRRVCSVLNKLGYHTKSIIDGYYGYEMLEK